LKLTAPDILRQKLIDGIIKEPTGGAHTDYEKTFANVKKEILKHLAELDEIKPEVRIKERIDKFSHMGVYEDKKKERVKEKAGDAE